MEHALSASEEELLHSLDFKLSPSSSYVIQRTSSCFYPTGSSTFSPTGVSVARVQLTSESFLDPETIRIQFTVTNLDPVQNLAFKTGPWGFWSRQRLLCGGTLLEDVFFANRINEMLTQSLQPTNSAINEYTEGFNISGNGTEQLNQNASWTVNFKPYCLGILHCRKMWPAFAAGGGLTLELYLADAVECTLNTQQWQLSNLQVQCDTLLLDSALENSYRRMLLEGKTLSIGYSTFNSILHSIPAGTGNVAIPIVRAATRIRGVLLSFGQGNNDPTVFAHPDRVANLARSNQKPPRLQDSTLQLMVALGAKRYPIKPIDSASFFFENLRKLMNVYSTTLGGLNIAPLSYLTTRFIMGVSMERVVGQWGSGVSSRQGDLIYAQFTGIPAASTVDRCYVTIINDQIAELSAAGCTVFD
jgi:hypothetical protein